MMNVLSVSTQKNRHYKIILCLHFSLVLRKPAAPCTQLIAHRTQCRVQHSRSRHRTFRCHKASDATLATDQRCAAGVAVFSSCALLGMRPCKPQRKLQGTWLQIARIPRPVAAVFPIQNPPPYLNRICRRRNKSQPPTPHPHRSGIGAAAQGFPFWSQPQGLMRPSLMRPSPISTTSHDCCSRV